MANEERGKRLAYKVTCTKSSLANCSSLLHITPRNLYAALLRYRKMGIRILEFQQHVLYAQYQSGEFPILFGLRVAC